MSLYTQSQYFNGGGWGRVDGLDATMEHGVGESATVYHIWTLGHLV